MKKYFLLFFLYISVNINAQEVLIPLLSQPSHIQEKKSIKADTLNLPFFDDFSSAEINPLLWDNNGVSINTNSSVLPPSFGVAQFDAVDSSGNFYASYEQVIISDILTSRPIDLNYPANQNIYFSFFYQAGGLQDLPDEKDSLLLQFYSPADSQWTTVWYATVTTAQSNYFRQVILPITDSKFLKKGFRFRFLNYSSLGTASYPSLISNCDFWYIDYVYLDRNRYGGDTTYQDVALQYPLEMKMNNYSAIPFEHYKENISLVNHSVLVHFRNNDGVSRTIDSLYVVFKDKQTASVIDTLFLGSYSFPPYGDFFVKKDNINYSFPTNYGQLNMEAQVKLITDNYDPATNNQVSSSTEITNFYAYDDGTAEMGYGLYGDGTFQAMVAAKFYTLKSDYLRGVQIYFNKTYRNRQPHYFYLMVWENDPETGKPGELIYEKLGQEIDFDSLNQFQTFIIDTNLTVSDTFYIGWKKTDEQLMNVGLDMNNPTENYKYFNITGTWQASSIAGNLMIRPIFGTTSTSAIESMKISVKIYPNPAKDYFTISVDYPSQVEIYTLSGRKIASYKVDSKKQIACKQLPAGLYIIRITQGNKIISKKIIIK